MASGDVVYQHLKCDVDSEEVDGDGASFKFHLSGSQGWDGETTQPDSIGAAFEGSWSLGSTYFKSQIVDPLKKNDIIIKEH
jgi:hypothetical protein